MNIMEIAKKYLDKILCLVALIALFFPMAKITTEAVGHESATTISGFSVALGGYIGILLILGPIALIVADFVAQLKTLKPILSVAVPIVCLIVTLVAFLQAAGIAAAANSAGSWAGVETSSSLGFGAILTILSHLALGVIGYLANKDTLRALLKKEK